MARTDEEHASDIARIQEQKQRRDNEKIEAIKVFLRAVAKQLDLDSGVTDKTFEDLLDSLVK